MEQALQSERLSLCPFDDSLSSPTSRSLLILNTPINTTSPDLFIDLWSRSSLRVCADGGANRLLDFARSQADRSLEFVPDYIKGDLDSIRPDTFSHYRASASCQIIRDDDQNSTDFGKCVRLIEEREEALASTGTLVVHGGLSGRLDQTLHTLHTLLILRSGQTVSIEGYKAPKAREETWIVDTDAGSMACALEPGIKHLLRIPERWRNKSKPLTCGILPIGVYEAILTTRGLKWNLENTRSSMTGLLSTSNHISPDTKIVEVITSQPVIWTMEIPA